MRRTINNSVKNFSRRERASSVMTGGVYKYHRALIMSAALMGIIQLTPRLEAATLLFDADGAGATASGGTGTWDTTSSIWRLTNASGALQTWTNGGGDSANLGGAAGTLTIADLTTINVTGITNGLSGAGTHVIAATGSGSINFNGGNIDTGTTGNRILQITAPITGSGTINVSTQGTLILGGNNSYTGGTTLSGNGTVQLDSGSALGTVGTITFGGSAGGTLRYTSGNTTDYSNRFSTSASQVFKVDTNGQSVTWGTALVSSGGALIKSGTGTLTLNGSSSFSGITTLSGGTLSISSLGVAGGNSSVGQNGNIVIGTGTNTATVTLVYTGSGEISDKSFSFNSTSTGGVIIDQSGTSGVLKITGNSTNAGTTKTITLQGSNGGNGWFAGDLVEGTGGAGAKLAKSGTNTWTVSGNNTYTGGTTINANSGTLIAGSFNALGNVSGSVFLDVGSTLGIATDPGVGIAPYVITTSNNSTARTISIGRATSGSGTGVNDTLGTLKYANGVVINVVAGANMTSGTPTLNLPVSLDGTTSGGTLSATGVFVNVTSLTTTASAGNRTITLAGATGGNTVGTISNGASATVAVVKSEAGTWSLNSTNTYSGITRIDGGTLALGASGSVAFTPSITINSGGTFDVSAVSGGYTLGSGQTLLGVGSVQGKLTNNGTTTPATLGTIGTLTFNAGLTLGGTLNIDVSGNTTGTADQLAGITALDIGSATLTLNNISTGGAPLDDPSYVIASYTSLVGTFATVNTLPAGYTINYNYQGLNQIALVAVPEPSSLGFIMLSAAALARRKRRANC